LFCDTGYRDLDLKFLIGIGFCKFDPGDQVTPKSIGFLCYSGWMCGPRLRKVGQGVLELLIGNKKVTDQPTDQTTEMCKAMLYE